MPGGGGALATVHSGQSQAATGQHDGSALLQPGLTCTGRTEAVLSSARRRIWSPWCCPGLLSARSMGGRCLCCCGMPHGCGWPAPRRVSSARRSDSGQRNSPGLNAQPGAPARAGASHGACNAPECSPRLAQMRPSSQPTVHRLLKKHSDECGTGDGLVMTQL